MNIPDKPTTEKRLLGDVTDAMPLFLLPRRKPWTDAGQDILDLTGGAFLSREEARRLSLVLWARGVPHRVKSAPVGVRLQVPPKRLREAVAEMRAYLEENPPEPVHLPDLRSSAPYWRQIPGVLWTMGAALVFLTATGAEDGLGAFALNWYGHGVGDTALMLAGQWWRAVTALCLHADIAHLLGNVCLGGVFLALLAAEIGLGPAWLVTLGAGTCGNLAKAWVEGPGGVFLGGSTAVFGGLGALAGVQVLRGHKGLRWRRALPFAAALMILAMLGAGSEEESRRIDLVGHFLGFGAGCVLGAAWAVWSPARFGAPASGWAPYRAACGLGAVFLVVAAWVAAFWL